MIVENLRRLRRHSDFRSRVPLPFGAYQSSETVIQATKTMADLVCRIGGTQYPVLRAVNSVMKNDILSDAQKDSAIHDLVFPPNIIKRLSKSLKQKFAY